MAAMINMAEGGASSVMGPCHTEMGQMSGVPLGQAGYERRSML